jgi:ATP-dependent Clp protease protease subunit
MELLKIKNKLNQEDHNDSGGSKYGESYVRLAKNRVIFLSEDITKEVGSAISALMLYFDNLDNEKDITILINSNGGDASALSAIYDTIQMINSPVKTVCIGKCYSAAAVLLATGTAGKRYAFKNSQVMIHGLQCSFPAIGESNSNGTEKYFNFLNKSNNSVMKIMSKHTGKSVQEIEKDCLRDFYLTAEQALEYGIIDKILSN